MKSLERLRIIGIMEGISYLALLGIAMPLKYMAHMPQAVRVAGSLHGILFISFCIALASVWRTRKWPYEKVAMAFLLSILPFGTFFLDKQIRKEEQGLISN
jgi:integral membrane protein